MGVILCVKLGAAKGWANIQLQVADEFFPRWNIHGTWKHDLVFSAACDAMLHVALVNTLALITETVFKNTELIRSKVVVISKRSV